MLMTFKRRFAPFVWEGSKTHTIRALRKRPFKAGEAAHCYTDARQKSMAMLGRWLTSKVEPIIVLPGSIAIDSRELDVDERNLFCWRDGFRPTDSTQDAPGLAYQVFRDYWDAQALGARAYPFIGEVIHWTFAGRDPVEPASKINSRLGQAELPPQLVVLCGFCQGTYSLGWVRPVFEPGPVCPRCDEHLLTPLIARLAC